MCSNSREVEIKSEERREICFDVENNQMPVKDLKRYFPLAVGLTYTKNDKEHCVREKDDYFILIPNISSYKVFYSKVSADKVCMTEKKEQEFKDILSKIKKTEESLSNEPKKSSSKKIGASELKQRTIQLGWKHRSDEDKKYTKVQKPLGGTKHLTLDLNKSYSVQDIIDIGVKAFKNDLNENFFNKCKIAVAANNDVEISTFKTENGVGLWKFASKLSQTSHRISLNILTTDTTTQETSVSSTVKVADKKQNVVICSKEEKEKTFVKKSATDSYNKTIENTVTPEDVRVLANMLFGAGETKKKEKALREALLELKKDKKVENTRSSTPQTLENNNHLNKIVNLDTTCDSSIVHVHSKYRQDQNLISSEEKISGNRLVRKDDSFHIENFPDCRTLLKEPSKCGKDEDLTEQSLKDISQVLKENNLKRTLNKEATFQVPSAIKRRKVELDNLNLKSNLNKEADFQVPRASNKKNVEHEFIKWPFITEIPLKDLKITKDFLGKGSYGLVRKGVWSKTKVAVKTIEVLYSSLKTIAKEVAILRQVSHENIVSIMGVCYDSTEFHIVMELVDGDTLHSIINKESVRKVYNLSDNDRHNLCKQICTGITFLHKHPLKIVHRDIKPANILVTRKKQIKICDLGLAKVSELNSVLMTSVGKRVAVGTRLYMAPEVLLYSNPVTQAADVWSLACTLTEVYNEGPVWQLDRNERNDPYQNLIQLLSSRTEPSLLRVPQFLRRILKKCFEYEKENRATAEDLLDCFLRTENIMGVGSTVSS